MLKTLTLVLTAAVLLLAGMGYAARDSQLLAHWHPMFIEPALNSVGLSFFGHDHTRYVHPVKGGAFADGAPVTSCWNYDFLEADCDGPDHYKAFADGTRIGAYTGDHGDPRISPPLAKACAVTVDGREVCVSDYRDDGRIVWRDTGSRIVEHSLAVGCPGPRNELPCKSKD